jgi:hypothetical protein
MARYGQESSELEQTLIGLVEAVMRDPGEGSGSFSEWCYEHPRQVIDAIGNNARAYDAYENGWWSLELSEDRLP